MTDFQRFELAVRLWVQRLGLLDWEIHIEEVGFSKAERDVYARVHPQFQQRLALIQWNRRNKLVHDTPEHIALHEVLHVLLSSVTQLAAAAGTVDHVAVDAEEHSVIKRLMKLLG